MDGEQLERALYLCRRRIEQRVEQVQPERAFYICSLSAKSLDLQGHVPLRRRGQPSIRTCCDPRFEAAVAIFHARYSTNTFPEWRLAQPFRMLAHNGEINTVRGNINWMRSHEIRMAADAFGEHGDTVKPVVQPGGSDSAALDNVYEMLVRAGRPGADGQGPADAGGLVLRRGGQRHQPGAQGALRLLQRGDGALGRPGPRSAPPTGAGWSRARTGTACAPLRVTETVDGLLIVGSEAGMTGRRRRAHHAPPARLPRPHDRGGPAGRPAVRRGRTDGRAGRGAHPYTRWLANMVGLEARIGPGPEPRRFEGEALARRQAAAGMTLEQIEMILDPMALEGKEAVGSMGDDSPLAVVSSAAFVRCQRLFPPELRPGHQPAHRSAAGGRDA